MRLNVHSRSTLGIDTIQKADFAIFSSLHFKRFEFNSVLKELTGGTEELGDVRNSFALIFSSFYKTK